MSEEIDYCEENRLWSITTAAAPPEHHHLPLNSKKVKQAYGDLITLLNEDANRNAKMNPDVKKPSDSGLGSQSHPVITK